MDSISKFINIFILIFGVFFVTTLIAANLDDRVTQESVTTTVTKFCDNVRKQGKLTPTMYDSFITQLDANEILFNIEMVYTKDVVSPGIGVDGLPDGTAVTTQESFYTQDILAGLYNSEEADGDLIDGTADGELWFNQGDTFYVKVKNRGKTLSERYGTYFPWLKSANSKITVEAGGLIRDEDWG